MWNCRRPAGQLSDKFRRALFCRPLMRTGSAFWPLPAPIRYTNLGCGCAVDEQLRQAGLQRWLQAEAILQGYQGRGADELVHRALKDFASQTLPFKRFAPNAAYYYTLLVAFLTALRVFRPVPAGGAAELEPPADAVDVAGKFVPMPGNPLESNGGHLEAASDRPLWRKSAHPPPFAWEASLLPHGPRVSAEGLRVFSSFRNYPRAPFELTPGTPCRNSHLGVR